MSIYAPKEYLLKKGKIEKVGRGRLSRDNKAFLESEARNGVVIEGYLHFLPKNLTAEDKPVESAPEREGTGIVDIGDPTRDESTMAAWVHGKEIGMRTVCNDCGSSLTYCWCQFPKVNMLDGEAVVVFKPRTEPFRKKF